MADYLALLSSAWGRSGGLILGGVVVFGGALFPAQAEDFQDPTRPPASIAAPSDISASETVQPAGLQSVIISKNRSAAIIDGQTVELGGKYGDVKLIEVNDTGVILQGARGKRKTMSLFPGVSISKKSVRSGS